MHKKINFELDKAIIKVNSILADMNQSLLNSLKDDMEKYGICGSG